METMRIRNYLRFTLFLLCIATALFAEDLESQDNVLLSFAYSISDLDVLRSVRNNHIHYTAELNVPTRYGDIHILLSSEVPPYEQRPHLSMCALVGANSMPDFLYVTITVGSHEKRLLRTEESTPVRNDHKLQSFKVLHSEPIAVNGGVETITFVFAQKTGERRDPATDSTEI